MNCKIASLTIPKKVKQLDAIPFLYANIQEFKVHKKNKYFTVSSEGILFSKNRKTLLYYPKNCKQKKYAIPNSVSKIGQIAFYGNNNLRNVVLTKRIKNFGYWVNAEQRENGQYAEYEMESSTLFDRVCGYYSNQILKWNYPDNINYFGTFQGTRLQSFIMPNSMKYVGKQTFYPDRNCRLYPDKNYELDAMASGGTLKKLVIGKNFCGEINGGKSGSDNRKTTLDLYFTSYSGRGRNGVFRLETIQVHKKNRKYKIQNHVLYSKNMDTIYLADGTVSANLTVSAKVHYIAMGAFCENQSIQSITFQGAIHQIQESAFEGCVNLKTAKFMHTVDRIGPFAFDLDEKMVFTGEKIRYIDTMAFRWVKSVTFDGSELVYIGAQAFQSCGISSGSLKLDGSLEYIGTMAFYHATLKEIAIHSTKALVVDHGAFSGTEVSVASITSDISLNLGEVIFRVCNSLKKVVLSKGTVIKGDVLIRLYTDYEVQYI